MLSCESFHASLFRKNSKSVKGEDLREKLREKSDYERRWVSNGSIWEQYSPRKTTRKLDLVFYLSLLQKKSHRDVLTTQKMKFSIKEFFSKWDQIRKKMQIWSHLLKKFLMENFIFLCSVCKMGVL